MSVRYAAGRMERGLEYQKNMNGKNKMRVAKPLLNW